MRRTVPLLPAALGEALMPGFSTLAHLTILGVAFLSIVLVRAARTRSPGKPPTPKPSKPASIRFIRTQEEFDDLARDPAHGGQITQKSVHERAVAVNLEQRGDVPGPIRRDPTGAADFVDATGQLWDVKGFKSGFPPSMGGFDLMRDAGKVDKSLTANENVMLDTTQLSAADRSAIEAEGSNRNWGVKVQWWP
jgi:hypothetical protein